jgi:AcrR family transcriptional regulator
MTRSDDTRTGPTRGRSRRRTQAERSARTREMVIQAVVDCIASEGLAATTAARIAERSGVTWGAIVHQFGDKDSVLLAVIERSFRDLSESLRESVAEGARSPADRVSLLVDETWRRLGAPSFRAFLEIVLNTRSGTQARLKTRHEDMVVTMTRGIWSELFGDFEVEPARIDTARKLTFATLLGLQIQGMLGPRTPRFTREIATLKQSVLQLLGLADGVARPPHTR